MIGAVAVVIVPVQVLSVWVQSTADEPVDESPYNALLDLGSGASIPITVLVAAIASLSLFFVGGIVSSFVTAWYAGRDISGGDALRATFRRSWVFIGAWALLLPVKAVSYALCILPLAVTMTFFALTAPLADLRCSEGHPGSEQHRERLVVPVLACPLPGVVIAPAPVTASGAHGRVRPVSGICGCGIARAHRSTRGDGCALQRLPG